MITRNWTTAACAALLLSVAACGSDSTGPSNTLDAAGALKSLTMGIGGEGANAVYGPASLASLASQLDQVNVTIDGKSQSMFALGLAETYPTGTCIETLIVDPSVVPVPGECTPPPYGFAMIFWQSHSADTPPDRLAIIAGNIGPINFGDLLTTPGAIADPVTGYAIYAEGQNDVWVSVSGTLTSIVTPTDQGCAVPLPPYAKSGSCKVATFDEMGTINFEPVTGTTNVSLIIPRQTIHGIWQTITETQTVTLPGA